MDTSVRPGSASGFLTRLAIALAMITVLLAGAGTASAVSPTTEPPEDYPPDAIVNLIDPFGCDPTSISGQIGAVEAGSTVTLELILVNETSGIVMRAATGDTLGTATATADAEGQARYTIAVPPNRYGSVVIRATGTDSVGDPFTLETSGEIVKCPPLPATGNSGTSTWLQVGAIALVAGIVLAAATRRRQLKASA